MTDTLIPDAPAATANADATTWSRTFSATTTASPDTVWALWEDVALWPQWNEGIVAVVLDGPFATGTRFRMTVPGDETFTSTLRDVVPGQGFTDETVVGDVTVVVDHRVRPSNDGTRHAIVSYGATVTGPGAKDIGEMVTGDFGDVLAALVARAEAATSARW